MTTTNAGGRAGRGRLTFDAVPKETESMDKTTVIFRHGTKEAEITVNDPEIGSDLIAKTLIKLDLADRREAEREEAAAAEARRRKAAAANQAGESADAAA